MRKIKFRAWDKLLNRWLTKDDLRFDLLGFVQDEINPDGIVLEQFTGLHDKAGKEIYENDVVKAHHFCANDSSSHKCIIGVMEFGEHFIHHGCATAGIEQVFGYFLDGPRVGYEGSQMALTPDCQSYIEIIGNIHENGELLQK